MRVILAILASMTLLSSKAQTHLPIPQLGYAPGMFFTPYRPLPQIDPSNKKWQLSSYASLSAGYIFYNGGMSYLSAPIGLYLSRPLTNNLSGFVGAGVTPTLLTFNRMLNYPAAGQGYPSSPLYGPHNLTVNPSIQAGLIYTNDDKTFSISGTISVEKGSYPAYPAYPSNNNNRSGK